MGASNFCKSVMRAEKSALEVREQDAPTTVFLQNWDA